ncbi:MAG: hypothetical protein R3C14_54305 [Caldilineaceae bacterium]
MAGEKSLTVKQMACVRELMLTPNIADAAKAAGVGERTLYRWLDDAEFKAALTEAQDAALDAAARRLVAMTEQATAVISEVLADADEKTSARLRAAQIVLDNVLRLVELRDLAQRVAALEEGANDDD